MAIVATEGENLEDDGPSEEQLLKSREERRRNGRYVAAGLVIFLLLFGIYQALLKDTPVYAGLSAPGLIMLIYVLWILRTSRNQNARLLRLKAVMAARGEEMESVGYDNQSEKTDLNEKNSNTAYNKEESDEKTLLKKEASAEKQIPTNLEKENYNRSYSIA